jgi:hypothetical protein
MAQIKQYGGHLRALGGLHRSSVVLALNLPPAFVLPGYCISLAFARLMHSLTAA